MQVNHVMATNSLTTYTCWTSVEIIPSDLFHAGDVRRAPGHVSGEKKCEFLIPELLLERRSQLPALKQWCSKEASIETHSVGLTPEQHVLVLP